MNNINDMQKQIISLMEVRAGDIFFKHTQEANPLSLVQLLIGKIKYSKFVHAGIVIGEATRKKKIIHVMGGGYSAITTDPLEDILEDGDYRIFRPKDSAFASRIALKAEDMFNRSEKNEIQYGISVHKVLFKKRPPDIYDDRTKVLSSYDKLYASKLSGATFYCTEFVAFVIQSAAHSLKWNYQDILNIEHTGATPSRLVDKLKRNKLYFEEFKSMF